jgi:hypothetical protein
MIEQFQFNMCVQTKESDFADHEIYYRIYANDQLITERSYPTIPAHQAVVESFLLKHNDIIPKRDVGNSSILAFFAKNSNKARYYYKIILENCSEKKVDCLWLTANGIKINPHIITSQGAYVIPEMGLCEVFVRDGWHQISNESVAILLKIQIK